MFHNSSTLSRHHISSFGILATENSLNDFCKRRKHTMSTQPAHWIKAVICASGVLFCLSGGAVDLTGVPPVANPQTAKDCQDLSHRWYEKRKALESAQSVCYRRDGGSVLFKGVFMPNCNAYQRAYISCASISDQICAIDTQKQEAVSNCHRDLAVNQRAEQDRSTAAAKMHREMTKITKARDNIELLFNNGPAAVLLQNYAKTPQRAGESFNEAAKEAARTTGTRAPDSQPELNRSGAASDALHRAISPNAAIAEIGSQSAGAARVRMGDALNMLDGARSRAAAEGVDTNASQPLPPKSNPEPVPMRPRTLVAQVDDDEEENSESARRRAAANLEAMRLLSESMQNTTNSLRALNEAAAQRAARPAAPTAAPGRKCRYRDVVGPNIDQSLPYCY